MQRRCNGTNRAGGRCNGKALPDSAYCIAHDPTKVVAITEARRKGGAARSNRARARRALSDAAMTPAELEGVIATTIQAILTEQTTPAVGSAIAALARAAVAIREATAIEERLAALEQAAGIERRRA
jgi:hypothetical protein